MLPPHRFFHDAPATNIRRSSTNHSQAMSSPRLLWPYHPGATILLAPFFRGPKSGCRPVSSQFPPQRNHLHKPKRPVSTSAITASVPPRIVPHQVLLTAPHTAPPAPRPSTTPTKTPPVSPRHDRPTTLTQGLIPFPGPGVGLSPGTKTHSCVCDAARCPKYGNLEAFPAPISRQFFAGGRGAVWGWH